MKENFKLSIIVPLYNVEEYIERCLLSIVTQVVAGKSYELIVVNDGSTDNSQSVVLALQKKYPFIQLINKENGGLSSARNMGLEVALGKYIFFVDADDSLSPNTLGLLLNAINASQSADAILFGINEVYPDRKTKPIRFHLPPGNTTLEVEDYMCRYTLLSAAWQGLFKRSLFMDHGIRMPEGSFAEDDYLVVKLFSVAQTVYYLPVQIYNYSRREESISNNTDTGHNEKLIQDRLAIFEDLVAYTQTFTGKRQEGLQRKLDFLALDVVRLLVRKSHTRETIDSSLEQLTRLEYYPLHKATYSMQYRILRMLLSKPTRVYFWASKKKSKKFF